MHRVSILRQSFEFGLGGLERSRSLAGSWARFVADQTLLPESRMKVMTSRYKNGERLQRGHCSAAPVKFKQIIQNDHEK